MFVIAIVICWYAKSFKHFLQKRQYSLQRMINDYFFKFIHLLPKSLSGWQVRHCGMVHINHMMTDKMLQR